jgi:hypothetical protein
VIQFSRAWLAIVSVISAVLLSACFHHRARGRDVPWQAVMPQGLDSARAEAWVVSQRTHCKDRFVVETDYRVFAVQCVRDSSSAKQPPDER